MATLGEAFIAIRADMRPFTKDLDKEVKKAADKLEKDIGKAVGDGVKEGAKGAGKSGTKVGDGLSDGLKDRLGDKKKPPWVNIAAALGGALDDGISALPAEVKAAIVLGLVASIPIIGALLTGALAGAITLGVAGLGIALASQFKTVKDEASRVFDTIRQVSLNSAAAFEDATIKALKIVEAGFVALGPKLTNLFDNAAKLAPILATGVVGFLDEIVSSIEAISDDLGPFGVELSRGFVVLGDAIGYVLETLIATGSDGRTALRDLFTGLSDILSLTADTLAFLTKVYNVGRNAVIVLQTAFSGGDVFSGLTQVLADDALETENLALANVELSNSMRPVIELSKAQQKEMDDLVKTIKDVSDATLNLIQDDIDYERALDNITESIKENGRTLDITTEKGRQNTEAFLAGIKAAEERAKDRIESGKVNAEQAAAMYNAEIEQIRKLATSLGVTGTAFDKVFDEATALSALEINPDPKGVLNLKNAAVDLSDALKQALERAANLSNFRLPAQGTRKFSEYADGDIITKPTLGLVGEAGPEVIIPLTKPARAAQLMRDSGLSSMLGSPSNSVAVYIGNEQLDARMYRIAEQNTKANSLSLSYGQR